MSNRLRIAKSTRLAIYARADRSRALRLVPRSRNAGDTLLVSPSVASRI